jgi:hypothetical protein
MDSEREPILYPGPRHMLLRRVAALTVDDLHALDAAVRALAAEKSHKHVDKGYFFAWWDGPRIDRDGERELEDLFASVLAAIATGLTGLDVERLAGTFAKKKSTGLEVFAEMLMPRRSHELQDAAIALIEGHVAPWDPRLAIVATWNMVCARALGAHLPVATLETLVAPWRRAIGEPPA